MNNRKCILCIKKYDFVTCPAMQSTFSPYRNQIFLPWTHGDARDVLLALISGHLHPLLDEPLWLKNGCQNKARALFKEEENKPWCAVGSQSRSSRSAKREIKGKERISASPFSPLMRQGQKERSAHAHSPRPIPFQMDRRLATPISQSKKWVEENIVSYPAWPNASECQASLGFNKTGWNGAENSHRGHMGGARTTAATP